MAEIYYNGDVVNSTVSNLNTIISEMSSLSSGLSSAVNQIISAKGFNEYVGGLSSDTFGGYVEQCKGYITGLSDFIRNQQVKILSYSDDPEQIKAFLSSLNRVEYARLDLSPLGSYVSEEYKASMAVRGFTSGLAVAGLSVVEGLGEFVETGADLVTLAGSLFKSIFTFGYDKIHGTNTTKELWDRTRAKVSEKKVESAFDRFYANTPAGQYLKNNVKNFDTVRNIGKGVGYSAGVIGFTVITGGLASGGIGAAGSVSAARLGATAGLMGFSKNTQNAWADGATTGRGLAYGAASGVWEGAQWFLGAKINQIGGMGDKIAQGIFKGASKGVGTRVFLDTIDSGAEGFVQPALTMIYKDYGGETFAENYKSAFAANGGWAGVAQQAAIGGAISAFTEYTGARKLLKSTDSGTYKPMTDAEIKASQAKLGFDADGGVKAAADTSFKNMDGGVGAGAKAAAGESADNIFKSTDTGYKPMTDAEIKASQAKLGFDDVDGGVKQTGGVWDPELKKTSPDFVANPKADSGYKPMTDAEIKASQAKLGFDDVDGGVKAAGDTASKKVYPWDDWFDEKGPVSLTETNPVGFADNADDIFKTQKPLWSTPTGFDDTINPFSGSKTITFDDLDNLTSSASKGHVPQYDANGIFKPTEGVDFDTVSSSKGHRFGKWLKYDSFLENDKFRNEVAFKNASNSQRVFAASYVSENGLPTSYKTLNGFARDNLFEYSNGIFGKKIKGVKMRGMHITSDMDIKSFLDFQGGNYNFRGLVDVNYRGIMELDQLIRDNPIAENMLSYRGIKAESAASILKIAQSDLADFESFRKAILAKGDFTTEGFFSSSATPFGPSSGRKIAYELYNKAGTPGLNMKNFNGISCEQEILIAPGTKYKYVDVVQNGDQWVIKCEVDDAFDSAAAAKAFRDDIDTKFVQYRKLADQWDHSHNYQTNGFKPNSFASGVPEGYFDPYYKPYHQTPDGLPSTKITVSDLDPNAVTAKIFRDSSRNVDLSHLPKEIQKELMGEDIVGAVKKSGQLYADAPSFEKKGDLFKYIDENAGNPGGSELAAAAMAKRIDEVGAKAGFSGGKYYEFLNVGDNNLPPGKNAEILTALINGDKALREQIQKASLEELGVLKTRFGLTDSQVLEMSDSLLGKNFIDGGLGDGANWKHFVEMIEEPMQAKVQSYVDAGKEPVLWSGFPNQSHELMDQHFATVSNTSIGGTYFIEGTYKNWDGNATPYKTLSLWEDLSSKYAEACCNVTDPVTGMELSSIKYLYPVGKNADNCFGQLFKEQEFPQIVGYGTIEKIVLSETDPVTMQIVKTVEIDISDISDYASYQGDPVLDKALAEEVFNMFLQKVKEAFK